MKAERNTEILTKGINAAREQMDRHPARPDYPRDLDRLYGWLEDKVYNLYEAIRLKRIPHVKTVAAEVIVTSSEIVEHAEEKLSGTGPAGDNRP